ncbi:hypothetical protein GE09DRAFT_1190266 [Coniochaeta sp. 2T2.1]|nr:hypothetical protein GE09DRAFT_1190266 [Coniochaeta sp. 2T2.1]
MLMSYIEGDAWDKSEDKLDLPQASEIVREIAAFLATTFKTQLRGIGNIYPDPSKVPSASIIPANWDLSSPKYNIVQRMVSADFITKSLCQLDYARGPFKSSNGYMRARLEFAEQDLQARLYLAREWMKARAGEDALLQAESQKWDNKKYTWKSRGKLGRRKHPRTNSADSDDESDESDESTPDKGPFEYDVDEICVLKKALSNLAKLRSLLDDVFQPPHPDEEPEPSMIYHPDMHSGNILVNVTHGKLGAVLDWEWVSAVPLWEACVIPKFLEEGDGDRDLHIKPDPSNFWREVTGEDGQPEREFDDEAFNWESALYRDTKLREVFEETMKELSPGWVEVAERSKPFRLYSRMLRGYDEPWWLRRFDLKYCKLVKMHKAAKKGLTQEVHGESL